MTGEMSSNARPTATARPEVAVELASGKDAAILANLMQLYCHDLSDVFGLDLGIDARFAYDKLPLYWSEPARRSAFLFRCAGKLSGFALTTRGSPASEDPEVYDVAEFFVVRRYRRSGVGQQAASTLWNQAPGRWIVRVSEGNQGGLSFWSSVIDAYTAGSFETTSRLASPYGWRIFSFVAAQDRSALRSTNS